MNNPQTRIAEKKARIQALLVTHAASLYALAVDKLKRTFPRHEEPAISSESIRMSGMTAEVLLGSGTLTTGGEPARFRLVLVLEPLDATSGVTKALEREAPAVEGLAESGPHEADGEPSVIYRPTSTSTEAAA